MCEKIPLGVRKMTYLGAEIGIIGQNKTPYLDCKIDAT